MEKTCSLIGQPSNKCSSAYLHATICPFSSPSSHKKMDTRNKNEHGNYVVVHVDSNHAWTNTSNHEAYTEVKSLEVGAKSKGSF